MSVQHIDGNDYWVTANGAAYGTGPGMNCTVAICPVELSVYGYRPTLPGSSTLIALYAICILVQIALGWRYKQWGFMIAMILGCITEIAGYTGRILLYINPWGQTGFLMQIVCVTMGPVFFSAAIYVMLYKIIKYIDVKSSRVRPAAFYWVFIICDCIALTLQGTGGGMSSSSNGSSQTGIDIAIAGLGFQVGTLLIFTICVVDYAIQSRNIWRPFKFTAKFKIFCAFLSLATLLIFIRCVYRVYELSQGYSSESAALRDEPLFIGLESVMIIIAAYSLIVAHPGPVFVQGAADGPASQEQRINQEKVRQATESSDLSD